MDAQLFHRGSTARTFFPQYFWQAVVMFLSSLRVHTIPIWLQLHPQDRILASSFTLDLLPSLPTSSLVETFCPDLSLISTLFGFTSKVSIQSLQRVVILGYGQICYAIADRIESFSITWLMKGYQKLILLLSLHTLILFMVPLRLQSGNTPRDQNILIEAGFIEYTLWFGISDRAREGLDFYTTRMWLRQGVLEKASAAMDPTGPAPETTTSQTLRRILIQVGYQIQLTQHSGLLSKTLMSWCYTIFHMAPKASILLCLVVSCVCYELFIDPAVIDLTPENFYNTTGLPRPSSKNPQPVNATSNWFAIFYSPYCPHCHRAMPSWNDLATGIRDKPAEQPTKIAKIDCVAHGDLCSQFKIGGYPTMIHFTTNNTQKRFSGQRSVEEYRKFMSGIYADAAPISAALTSSAPTGAVPSTQTTPSLTLQKNQQQRPKEVNGGFVESFREFFENLTWVGMLMMVLMVVLVGMLVYVIFDKDSEGQQFREIQPVERESRQISGEL